MTTLRLPRLYPIADLETIERCGWTLDVFVRGLAAGGAQIVQLRDKRGAPQQVLRHAEIVTEALAGSGCIPVMNDRADLALLAGWNAVHVGHLDLPPDAVRRVFGARDVMVGVSTHTAQQVIEADAGSADYIAVGPVFRTGTKVDAEPVIGLEGVRRARTLTSKPIVAIGGITLENAAAVMDAGADSVAAIGALVPKGAGSPGTAPCSQVETVEQVVRDFLRCLS